jgi:protein TonB
VHEEAARKVQRWSFREQFLDTDRLRHINYGNLVLRREAHLFLAHGVVVSVLLLFAFWTFSANWNRLMALFGGGSDKDTAVQCYEIVTNVTQLPPPPPIAPPEPPKVATTAAAVDAPKVGKIKQVAEAPEDQTFATQKEIRQAIQQGTSGQDSGSSGDFDAVVEFVNCQNPPTVVSTPRLVYPEMARIAGLEGRVFVRVLISEEGRPMKAEIVKRIPADQTVFDKEAVRIAMETKYTAGQQNGRRVRVWMTIPVRFTLHEG